MTTGCKISAEATSGNSGRGGSVNCIAGSENVTLLIDGKIYEIPMEYAYDLYSCNLIFKDNDTVRIEV